MRHIYGTFDKDNRFIPDNIFLHDAEQRTDSWKRRHSSEVAKQLGVWRWKGIQDNAAMILDAIAGKRAIDFGGADGPLGFGSQIEDIKIQKERIIDELYNHPEVIFTSHTLEHVEKLNDLLKQFYGRLEPGGLLIAHVPAYTCERWRAENYSNPNQEERHKWTFILDLGIYPPLLFKWSSWLFIDVTLKQLGFTIEFAEYVGDDSILIFARKPHGG